MNVHHTRWLRFSNGESPAGIHLKRVCDEADLRQLVKEPTREQYLLDLCLTDMEQVTIQVKPKIADHQSLLASVKCSSFVHHVTQRQVWHYKGAAWQNIRCELRRFDWQVLKQGTVDSAVDYFMSTLNLMCQKYIPRSVVQVHKQTHPWLTPACHQAIRAKNNAEGSDTYVAQCSQCSGIINDAYHDYVVQLKDTISKLPKGSKKWWSLNRQLLSKKSRVSSIPPLKNADDRWLLASSEKANEFAQVWLGKCALPGEVELQFVPAPTQTMQGFVAIRSRDVLKVLQHVNVNKATGGDGIGNRILKELSSALALPIAILCRRMLQEGVWPRAWQDHLLVPIFKRSSVYKASNYRGVHLTSSLSKVVEHVIGNPLIAFLQQHGFGDSQWAFRKQCSSRDLALICMSTWIKAICSGKKVGLYLSDISGAFDRVFKKIMLAKLHSVGVPDIYLDFLSSYLEPRIGHVAVESVLSDVFTLADSVFQGTVLGPTLWNVFFHDVAFAATGVNTTEAMFADDLSIYKTFDSNCANDVIIADMQAKKQAVHKWGVRNRVTFDAAKEHIVILHPLHGVGEDFKLLGCLIDVQLRMDHAIDSLLARARPKIHALLRTKNMYPVSDLLMQYKTHIWSILEYQNGTILHAAPSALAKLNDMQKSFVHKLLLTEVLAFLDFNFAPAALRRDIGILGFIHKRVLGQCHVSIQRLLPFIAPQPRWHDKQLETHIENCIARSTLFCRSLFGMVAVYNRLPQDIVESASVKQFQSKLTHMAKQKCDHGCMAWQRIFHTPCAWMQM